jgi:hypothetical protein
LPAVIVSAAVARDVVLGDVYKWPTRESKEVSCSKEGKIASRNAKDGAFPGESVVL